MATLGVAGSAAITGLASILLLDLSWRHGMLLGAIVGSTDAAAVFSVLRRSGVTLDERIGGTLEIESGMNDPMAVYLTLALIGLITASRAGAPQEWLEVLLSFAAQFGWGAFLGLAGGLAMAALLLRLPEDGGGDAGILALMLGAGGLAVFGASGWLGGSGDEALLRTPKSGRHARRPAGNITAAYMRMIRITHEIWKLINRPLRR